MSHLLGGTEATLLKGRGKRGREKVRGDYGIVIILKQIGENELTPKGRSNCESRLEKRDWEGGDTKHTIDATMRPGCVGAYEWTSGAGLVGGEEDVLSDQQAWTGLRQALSPKKRGE